MANIVLLGNIHTHDEVIYRELTFAAGDTVLNLQAEIQRSRSNLINTLLFNFVDIKEAKIDSMYSDVMVVVKERWYIWPFPIFKFADPNFNTWWISKDFSRTNYGINLLWRNLRGWNEDLGFKTQLGYSKEFAVAYRMPYLTKRLRLGMLVGANYTQQEEITVGTVENKRIFYRSGTGKSRVEFGGRLGFFYRKRLYVTHTVDLRYQNLQVNDSVTRLTSDYFYQNKPHMEFPGMAYVFRYDKRDNKGYPLKGILVQAELHKYGISLIGDKNLNVAWVSAYTKNYFPLG
ncbi:MAG TPA: BamA/TamA family outer membrane protein, partial [Flavobacteriales bacterium]|nr:BamA/TamA family outer membrane protein [Flavobacteriales bacterium]